ncbi:hypothetical protein L6164_012994 [Bauhinia variegata]|uniref:Uncharacterized protein n=1 Tax=Bauhinia variegata TaxID=167791 RepID=A0ACB9PB99_BAUVA|nr:hypothetical protein L6164_012994 [Bauhinia variegata]
MEVATTVSENLVELLFTSLGRHIGYLIFSGKYVEDLKEHVRKLQRMRERVRFAVEGALMNGEEIDNVVRRWLVSVDETSEFVEMLLEEASDGRTKFCCSLFSRHKLSRKTRKTMNSIDKLLTESQFERVSFQPHLSIFSVLSGDLEEFESRKPIMEGIMEAIEDPGTQVVGIGGMPGVGKTSLVKRIAWQVYQCHLFDEVVMAAVTHDPDVRNIQTVIADTLGLKLEEEGVRARASRLYMRLKQERRVLIILDDIWGRLDLVQIGIPKGMKIIVIGRDQNVFLQMEAQKIFYIEPLLQNEAVSLFLKRSGITDDLECQSDPEYHKLAVDISNSLGRLPLPLLTVATGLRNKEVYGWKDTLLQIERNHEDVYRALFSTLEMSYQSLEREQNLIFSLCAAVEEHIFAEHLLKLCLGWDLYQFNETVEEARRKLISWIDSLKRLSLLQDDKTNDCYTMNNAIRHGALHIAFREHNMFVVRDGIEDRKWPDDEDVIHNFTAIILLGNHRGELPEKLACPKLKLLYVHDESQTLTIPGNLFERVNGGLKVLSLTNLKLASLPSSIRVLKSIHTLCLDKCELDDVTLLGELISLKVLSLAGSTIDQLPWPVSRLINLCLLDLSNCSKLKTIPPNVLSNLTRLQELLLPNSYEQWQYYDGSNVDRTNACLDELSGLNNLKALDIHIPYVKVVPGDFIWHELVRYNICIGQVQGNWSSNYERKLQLNLCTETGICDWVKPLLAKSEELWLKELKGFRSTLELGQEAFPNLKHLHIQDTAQMECLMESVQNNPFAHLELLVLNNLISFKALLLNQPLLAPFHELRVVKIEGCNKLDFIFFSSNIPTHLPKLSEMEITDCSKLGSIVVANKDGTNSEFEFPQLRALTLQNLPELVGFLTMEVTNEERLNNSHPLLDKIVLPNLEKLNLRGLNHFTNIWDHSFSLQVLKSLTLFGCDDLKYIFLSVAAEELSHLQELRITACNSVEQIVLREAGTTTDKIVLPKVNTLILENLAELHSFCWDDCFVQWQSLKKLRVAKCPNIKQFALGIIDGPNLEAEVTECPWQKEDDPKSSIEYLFILSDPHGTQTILDIETSETLRLKQKLLQPRSFRKLKKLSASNCDENLSDFLSELLHRSYELEHLEVKQCKLSRQVFNLENLAANGSGTGKYFAMLKSIKLRDLPLLKCIWDKDPMGILGLQNLEEMEIFNCGFPQTIMSTSLAQHLWNLRVLKISSCPTIEVFHMNLEDVEGKREIVLPELQTLELVHLPKFKTLYDGDLLFQFPSMRSLTIENCPSMDAFTGGFLSAQTLPVSNVNSERLLHGGKAAYPKMEILKLQGLVNIENIWQGSFSSRSFSALKDIEVNTFGKMKYVIPSNMLPVLRDLEKLTVKNCDLLIEILQVNEGFEFAPSEFPKPRTLILIGLPKLLRIIKEPVGSKIFENLQSLQVKRCDSLQNLVFPSSCLQKLRKLEISECEILERIIFRKEGSETETTHLESIVLEQLPKLSTFFQEIFQFPSLREISVIDCAELKTFPSGFFSPATSHFFGNQGFLEKLQKVHLTNLNYCQKIWNEIRMSQESLSELQVLVVDEGSKLLSVIPSSLLKRMRKLEEFTVKRCKTLELAFDIDEDNSLNELFLPGLKKLVLTDLPQMALWRQEPRKPVFRNLISLEFVHCSRLKKLFSISIVKNLQQLELLKLYGCEKMEHVIEGEAESAKVVVFEKLKHLILKHLPNLRSFCEEDCDFKWPQLEMVRVKHIPEMKTFAKGIQETPKLKEFYISYVLNCWRGDLNETVKYLHNSPDLA